MGYREGFCKVVGSTVSMVGLVPFGAAVLLAGNAGDFAVFEVFTVFAVFAFDVGLPAGVGSDGLVLALSSPRAFLFA